MRIEEIKKLIESEKYKFLVTDARLNQNIILLTVWGSHAYGIENTESDIDIRGIALNSKKEILLGNDFEHVEETNTDMVIFSFNKMLNLLTENKPNALECLGCLPEHYLFLNAIGTELLQNRKMFLSKCCIRTFSSFAKGQLHKMKLRETKLESGFRNEDLILKIKKNMVHSIRSYMMCIDLLEKGDIITYRFAEHDLLMSIRNGDFLDKKGLLRTEFYDLLNEYEKRFAYAKENTSLPDIPDHKRIDEFKMNVNERIVKGIIPRRY